MNEKDFLFTLKEYIKSEGLDELYELLKKCQLTFNYTNVFASKNWQFRAYVDIRVPISKIKAVKGYKAELQRYCAEIFVEDDQYAFYGVDVKPLMLSIEEEDTSDPEQSMPETKKVKVNDKTIDAIAQIITGDNGKSIYKKGYELVSFFNRFGWSDVYEQGFPTRIVYAKEKLISLNEDGRISEVLEQELDPRDYVENEEKLIEAVTYLNKFLKYDGFMLELRENFYKLVDYQEPTEPVVLENKKSSIGIEEISKKETKEINVFFSYSHADETLRDELEKHLVMLKRRGIINTWHDRKIDAGSDFENTIDENLKSSQIILLLISVDFLASAYCYENEMKEALRMNEAGEAVVVPIILRPCDWQSAEFSKLQALPKDGKSVVKWAIQDEAMLNIAKGIENIALKF